MGFLALLAGTLTACAGAPSTRVAVRIGDVTINAATVTHWGRILGESAGQAGSGGERALRRLIVSKWIVGAAAEQGLSVSSSDVQRRMREKGLGSTGASGGGDSWTGENRADQELDTATELAGASLRRKVEASEQAASHVPLARVVQYWRRSAQFLHRERRTLNFIESLPSLAAGRRLKTEIAQGRRSILSVSVRETREPWREPPVPGDPGGIIHTAIFHTPLHVLEGPMPWNGVYAMFEVVAKSPPGRTPLARVKRLIVEQLTSEARARARATFMATWRAKWRSVTNCLPGFVISLCRQYHGPAGVDVEPFAAPSD